MAIGETGDNTSFFVPEYLKTSRHVEKLALAHEARVQAVYEFWINKHNHPSAGLGTRSTSSSRADLTKMSSTAASRPSTQDLSDRMTTALMDDIKMIPSRWSDVDRCQGLEILNDGLEVRFQGVSKGSDDAAAVRSDCPMPKACGIYYFEVTVMSRGKEGLIGIGFSSINTSLNRLPGWENNSWAYHGDDGFSFACTASGKAYGPRFASMDVIGCGVNFKKGTAFFTKNGIFLGDAFSNITSDKLYPSVGMKKPGEHLSVNFGRRPFVFDIVSIMEKEKAAVKDTISNSNQTALISDIHATMTSADQAIQELVSQYLVHEGYVETARGFKADVTNESQSLYGTDIQMSSFEATDDLHAIQRQSRSSSHLSRMRALTEYRDKRCDSRWRC